MSGSGFAQFIPLILIFVVFLFFSYKTSTKESEGTQNYGFILKKGR